MKWCCLLIMMLLLPGCTYTGTGDWYEKPEETGTYEPDARDLVTVMIDLQGLLEKTAEHPASVDGAQLETAIGPGGGFTFGVVFTACQAADSNITYSGSCLQESSLSGDSTVDEVSIAIDVVATGGPFTSEIPIVLRARFHPQEEVYSAVSASLDGFALERADVLKALEQVY
ncbi:MAG: hypothetical protein ACQEQU_08810 [Spirochaetota bacterium]